MSKDDGGPAFPQPQWHGSDGSQGTPWNGTGLGGISMRDYFAAAALQGWLSGPCQGNVLDDYNENDMAFKEHQIQVAITCYGYADAMLAERSKP